VISHSQLRAVPTIALALSFGSPDQGGLRRTIRSATQHTISVILRVVDVDLPK